MTDLRRTVTLLVGAAATLLGGCASTMSGLGGEGSYACKAPVGSQCTSVSGVYANSMHGQPPASALPKPAKEPTSTAAATTAASASTAAPGLGAPPSALRSQPRVLRLWIAPWEDADGDLHEASVVHVLVDTGRWLIERVTPANRQRVDAVRPPIPSTAPASRPSPASEPASSTETTPDRFPPRTGLLPGSGPTQEP
ncbi:MAG: type IV conjugative transfer system lipoprotein TraV [Burkholderiaceae bacterium]|nr:type IV conjugative transfer system lipoprotein TraV [Burkholderiaceae bacterium]